MSVTIVPWSTGTDEQIAAMLDAAAAGEIDLQRDGGWKVGDRRIITLTGLYQTNGKQQNAIVITSFDEYMGCGNLLQFDFEDSPGGVAIGDEGLGYKYTISYRYYAGYCVDAMPAIFRHRLKTFDVLYNAGSEQEENIVTIPDNLLANRSRIEVFGDGPHEGTRIAYYEDLSHRIKNKNTYTVQENKETAEPWGWWLRTSNGTDGYYIVTEDGTLDSEASRSFGLSLFGCLGGYNGTLLQKPIAINAYTFPDEIFRNVISAFDIDGDGYLSQYELENCTVLRSHMYNTKFDNAKSIQGIELLSCIEILYCTMSSDYTDENLDLSNLTLLKDFSISYAHTIKTIKFDGSRLRYVSLQDITDFEDIEYVHDPDKMTDLHIAYGMPTSVHHRVDVTRCHNLFRLTLTGFVCDTIDIRNNSRLLLAHSSPQSNPKLSWEYGYTYAGSNVKGTLQAIKTEAIYNAGYNPLAEQFPEDNLIMARYQLIYDPESTVITGAFSIIDDADDAYGKEGDNVVFHCESASESEIQYAWEYRNYFTNMASAITKGWTLIGNGQDLAIKASGFLEYHVFRCHMYLPSSRRQYYVEDKTGANGHTEYFYHLHGYTRIAHLKVYYPVKILKQPEDSINVVGGISNFVVEASNEPPEIVHENQTYYHPDRTQNSIAYSWQQSSDNGETWANIQDATSKTLSVIVTEDIAENTNLRYRCIVSCDGDELTTDPVRIIVVDNLEGRPSILSQPDSLSIMEGRTGKFEVDAYGENLTYSWEYSTDNGSTWVSIRNSNTKAYEILATLPMNGYRYRCVVTNDLGTATSDAATLTVTADTSVTKPTIASQPSSITVAEGSNATFAVSATGSDISYQWQVFKNNQWQSITDETNSSYVISATRGLDKSRYRCIVSNAAGAVYSNEATLTVSSGVYVSTPQILTHPKSVNVDLGEVVTFWVRADGGGLTYQWQKFNDGSWYDITGAVGNTYTLTARVEIHNTRYRCVVTNTAGSVYSNSATLSIRAGQDLSFYGYHSIIISGKNTYGEWEMYPTSRPHVAPPEVKTSYVDLPGADGGLDYTDLLTGEPRYGYRKGSWEFLLIPQDRWASVYRSLVSFLHGRQHTVILEDDPDYVYTGRLSVNEWQSAAHNSLITIDYILEPHARNISGEEESAREAEILDAANELLSKAANTGMVIAKVTGGAALVDPSMLFEDGDNIAY